MTKTTRNQNGGMRRQQAIGLCINFNYDPDSNGITLTSILKYYLLIHEYLVIITPSPFHNLSQQNQQILNQSNVSQTTIAKQESNGHLLLKTETIAVIDNHRLFHIECIGVTNGYYQHKCTSLCAQFYQQLPSSRLKGILYLPDDVFFNYSYVFRHPSYYSLDEFWIPYSSDILDCILNQKQKWWWWTVFNYWERYCEFFTKNLTDSYQHIFETLYGKNKLLAVVPSDIVYIPFADKQLQTFINVTQHIMTLFPNIFCELALSIIIELTMALCKHWPYQNDRYLFNSTVNLLNNRTRLEQLDVIHLNNPYNRSQYQYRPSLLSYNGYIWPPNRDNELDHRIAIYTGIFPDIVEKQSPNPVEFLHPLKLSKLDSWSYRLWMEAMDVQLKKIKDYIEDFDRTIDLN
ncbi:unnamed protein product [Didymodactylos carnosus]|uniref:Uncharacterized protein n=1 Tax=Didymodactylos carnosus TaxID=1234261 RepID=A0A814LLV2_9BILA|nr:unnamed protein product [Didymodactylos carnosus]CAF1065973.1 unnamed protein product [Didymodactylos carnosus]CAF3590419.1 unnamed protein product [Didymodactylos carnosus]CAF3833656.1 unnamed protein product [Didymodactylos carnosus]